MLLTNLPGANMFHLNFFIPDQSLVEALEAAFADGMFTDAEIGKLFELGFPIEEMLKQFPLAEGDVFMHETLGVTLRPEISAEMYESVALETEKNYPDPLLSALTDGCIQNRRDRSNGAVYNTVTVETLGLINTCDAISAINELVFCRKKYTMQQLITAVKANYEGYEEVLSDILSCKKYGMGDPDYGYIIKTVGEEIFAACKKVSHGNRYYLPSLHTLNENVNFGNRLYATLDGRRAGEPVNKNAGPSLLLKKREHTSDIVSATSFDQSLFSGGQPLDLYFEKQWFETKELRDRIKALIKTYFELGGLQLQVNSVDIELLEKATLLRMTIRSLSFAEAGTV
jgi:formate C-acetyltransferase